MKLEEPAAAYTVNPTLDPLVIKNLREYGDKKAWQAAQDLRKCL